VAQYSFSKCTAKQMCFESEFECDYSRSTSDLFWKLIPIAAGIVAKSAHVCVFKTVDHLHHIGPTIP